MTEDNVAIKIVFSIIIIMEKSSWPNCIFSVVRICDKILKILIGNIIKCNNNGLVCFGILSEFLTHIHEQKLYMFLVVSRILIILYYLSNEKINK